MTEQKDKSSVDLFEHILEMKDTSELMVNLAYSSLLYHNKEIAHEVLVLEEAMDELHKRVKREALKNAACGQGSIDRAMVLLQIADSTEAIADGAVEIADVVLRDIEPHPVLHLSMMESDTMMATAIVSNNSPFAGKTIGELKVASETGMWILAIKRGGRWTYGPDEFATINAGDLLLVKGPSDAIEPFKCFISGNEEAEES